MDSYWYFCEKLFHYFCSEAFINSVKILTSVYSLLYKHGLFFKGTEKVLCFINLLISEICIFERAAILVTTSDFPGEDSEFQIIPLHSTFAENYFEMV